MVRNMTREISIWFIAAASILVLNSHALESQGAVERHSVSAGHIFWLPSCCDEVDSNRTVTWSRGGNQTLKNVTSGREVMPPGVEVRGKTLWFLPADPSHSGHYTCQGSNRRVSWEKKFLVSVDPGLCPAPADFRFIPLGTSKTVPCRLGKLVALDPSANITWFKNCSPLEKHGLEIRFLRAEDGDAGVYTCLVQLTLDGLEYTASRSTRLHISHERGLKPPQVVYPRKATVVVELGARLELHCKAFLGAGDEMYWTVNQQFTENFPQLNETWDFVEKSNVAYGQSTLTISEVLPKFLDVPFLCIAQNSLGEDIGEVWLQAANHSGFYMCVAFSLVFPVVVLALATCWLFRVDLVLAYRRLLPPVAKQRIPDGKLYDAYVSYLHGDGLYSSGAESFALQELPEVLESQHGYTLYISGRDDCPGEAMHNAISETMKRSRRLIIILSAQSGCPMDPKMDPEEGQLPPTQRQDSQGYEQLVGLYDALTQNGLHVILVETDAQVDYGGLPESLRYLRRKQGALRWRPTSGNNNSPTAHPNGHFWKYLRYHMPSKPVGRGTPPLTIL